MPLFYYQLEEEKKWLEAKEKSRYKLKDENEAQIHQEKKGNAKNIMKGYKEHDNRSAFPLTVKCEELENRRYKIKVKVEKTIFPKILRYKLKSGEAERIK